MNDDQQQPQDLPQPQRKLRLLEYVLILVVLSLLGPAVGVSFSNITQEL